MTFAPAHQKELLLFFGFEEIGTFLSGEKVERKVRWVNVCLLSCFFFQGSFLGGGFEYLHSGKLT